MAGARFFLVMLALCCVISNVRAQLSWHNQRLGGRSFDQVGQVFVFVSTHRCCDAQGRPLSSASFGIDQRLDANVPFKVSVSIDLVGHFSRFVCFGASWPYQVYSIRSENGLRNKHQSILFRLHESSRVAIHFRYTFLIYNSAYLMFTPWTSRFAFGSLSFLDPSSFFFFFNPFTPKLKKYILPIF